MLDRAKKHAAGAATRTLTKSGIMVGLGETDDEVVETMRDLRGVGVDVVTIGQYLRPSPKHHEVKRFVPPETFALWEKEALAMGFLYAASGPLVRSSYKAAEVFVRALLEPGVPAAPGEMEAALEARLARARVETARHAEAEPSTAAPTSLIAASSLVRKSAG